MAMRGADAGTGAVRNRRFPLSQRGRQGECEKHQHDDGDDHRHRPFVRLGRRVQRIGERRDREDEHREGCRRGERGCRSLSMCLTSIAPGRCWSSQLVLIKYGLGGGGKSLWRRMISL